MVPEPFTKEFWTQLTEDEKQLVVSIQVHEGSYTKGVIDG